MAAVKSVRDRVRDSFSGDKKEQDAEKYVEWLLETLRATGKSIRRSAVVMLLLMATFELILTLKVAEVSIGIIKISQAGVLLTFIPAAVMYFLLELVIVECREEEYLDALSQAMAIWNPKAEANDLDTILVGYGNLYWNTRSLYSLHQSISPSSRVERVISVILIFGAVLGVLAFEVHAFVALFNALHAGSVLLWINLAVSSALFVGFVVYVGAIAREG